VLSEHGVTIVPATFYKWLACQIEYPLARDCLLKDRLPIEPCSILVTPCRPDQRRLRDLHDRASDVVGAGADGQVREGLRDVGLPDPDRAVEG
jgi:hypothetical protein